MVVLNQSHASVSLKQKSNRVVISMMPGEACILYIPYAVSCLSFLWRNGVGKVEGTWSREPA